MGIGDLTKYSYKGKTILYYIVYKSPQKYRDGSIRLRTRVKRVYVSGKLLDWQVGEFTKKSGKRVFGVRIIYENPRKGYRRRGFTAHRGRTTYHVSPATIGRTVYPVVKIVELPRDAKDIRLTRNPPKGALMDVA